MFGEESSLSDELLEFPAGFSRCQLTFFTNSDRLLSFFRGFISLKFELQTPTKTLMPYSILGLRLGLGFGRNASRSTRLKWRFSAKCFIYNYLPPVCGYEIFSGDTKIGFKQCFDLVWSLPLKCSEQYVFKPENQKSTASSVQPNCVLVKGFR